MIHVTFVMEQHLGHRAYCENLKRFFDSVPEVTATWVPVTYTNSLAVWSDWSFLPERLKGTLNGRFQVRKSLRHTPADVLLFNTQVPAAIAGKLVQQKPYLLSIDITPIQYDKMAVYYGHKPDGIGFFSHYKHKVNANLLAKAAYLLPWSSWVRDSLIQDYQIPPERIMVVPPGVDLDQWRPRSEFSDGPLKILFVGGDFYRKGGDILRDAFRQLPPGRAELHMVTRTQLEPEANVHVYNNLQPNSPELIKLYQTADVFVLPTKAEAFGIAAVEASAAGLPVVATAVGGLPDIVVANETGFLVEPGDVSALARCLHQLVENPHLRRQLGQGARQRAEQYFDARRNAAHILELLQTTVARNNHL